MTRAALPDFTGRPVSRRVWERHVAPVTLPARGVVGCRDLLEHAGLPAPLPPLIDKMLDAADELDVRVVLSPGPDVAAQWNAVFGAWHFDTRKLEALRAPSADTPAADLADWMDWKAHVVYGVVHETAHALVYELGLRGLFRAMDAAHEREPAWNLHIFGEMVAEYLSHYELGLATRRYWGRHFRPFAERSEGQATNAGLGALRAGLRSARERAALVQAAWFDRTEDPAPLDVDGVAGSAELAAIWLGQRAYAQKTWRSADRWWRHYWGSRSLRAWVRDFVPAEPAIAWTGPAGRPRARELPDFASLAGSFDEIFLGWQAPPPAIAAQLRARRQVQRDALAACQLERLLESPRLLVEDRRRTGMIGALAGARARLVETFGDATARPLGALSRAACERVAAQSREVVEELVGSLGRLAGRPEALQLHPATDGLDLSDLPSFDLGGLATIEWPRDPAAQAETRDRLLRELPRLAADLTDAVELTGGDAALAATAAEAAGLAAEATILRVAPARAPAFCATLRRWLSDALTTRRLLVAYPFRWLLDRPYVEPLIGFRIR